MKWIFRIVLWSAVVASLWGAGTGCQSNNYYDIPLTNLDTSVLEADTFVTVIMKRVNEYKNYVKDVEGLDTPVVYKSPTMTYLVYNKYRVMINHGEYYEGIKVFKSAHRVNKSQINIRVDDTPLTTIGAKMHNLNFFGLKDNYLFYEEARGPEYRYLHVYDLTYLKEPVNSIYFKPFRVDKNNKLFVWEEINREPDQYNCPELLQWKKRKMGAAFEEMVGINLLLGQVSRTSDFRCNVRR